MFHLKSGIGVGVVVSDVADVLLVFEGDAEGQSIEG